MRPFLAPLLLSGCLVFASLTARAEVIDIGNAELSLLMQQGVPIIDIRTQMEWEETGIVAGSRLNTFFDEHGRADPAAWLEKIKPYAETDQPVIVICRTGNRTRAVSRFLSQQAGYATVYNVKAGIMGWIQDSQPVVPATSTIAACRKSGIC